MDTDGKLIKLIREKKGIAVIFIALILFALVAFVGLAIDIGYMYVAKGQLQNAADAGALAGAALLDATNNTTQTDARNKAEFFTEANKVVPAGTQVQIENDGSNELSDSNDITVGNWDDTKSPNDRYSTTRTPINAVQVRARRTSGSPGGQVQLFFARVFGWTQMGAAAQAIAVRQGLATPAITICYQTCAKKGSEPFDLYLGDNTPGNTISYAWTLFNSDSNVNANDIRDYIDGVKRAPNNICGNCMTTNNGVTQPQNELLKKYADSTFDSRDKVIVGGKVVSWKIAVPVVDYACNYPTNGDCTDPTNPCACPPSTQGKKEPYHVSGLAILDITDVRAAGEGKFKGFTVTGVQCYGCPITYDQLDKIAFGKRYVYLVR